MKLLGDMLPIIAFFIVFKTIGGTEAIYPATATAIGVAALMVLYQWARYRTVGRQQLITLGILVVLGGLTLALHDLRYIKWKPTIVSWMMAGSCLLSGYFGPKTLVERMFGSSLEAPPTVWSVLNKAWSLFFVAMGLLNLYFAFYRSTEAWVNFKVFGTFGLSLTFAALQAVYLARYASRPSQTTGD